jgi:hypothetical protein
VVLLSQLIFFSYFHAGKGIIPLWASYSFHHHLIIIIIIINGATAQSGPWPS